MFFVVVFLAYKTTDFMHVVECPCGLLKCKYISLNQLQYCNIACVLDCKPLLYKGRWHYYCILLCTYFICTKSVFVLFLSGVHVD